MPLVRYTRWADPRSETLASAHTLATGFFGASAAGDHRMPNRSEWRRGLFASWRPVWPWPPRRTGVGPGCRAPCPPTRRSLGRGVRIAQVRRIRHDEQPRRHLGRRLQEVLPERARGDRGQGIGVGAAGAHRGHLHVRPDEPRLEALGDRRLQGQARLSPDAVPAALDMLAVFVHKDNPLASSRCSRSTRSSRRTARRLDGRRPHLGRPGPPGRVEGQADQPLRPQLRRAAPTATSRSTPCSTATSSDTVKEQPGVPRRRAGRRERQVSASATAASATGPPTCGPCPRGQAGGAAVARPSRRMPTRGDYPLAGSSS